MRTLALPRISAFVLAASCLVFTQQPSATPAAPAKSQPQTSEPTQQPPAVPKTLRTPKQEAWQILNTACTGDKTSRRALAIRVLALMPNDAKALKLAEGGLDDEKPEVRSAAAVALGEMKSRTSIAKLRAALDDNDPSVALAAAHSLETMHDDSAYEVYYEVLTGQRKAGRGLIASQTSVLVSAGEKVIRFSRFRPEPEIQ